MNILVSSLAQGILWSVMSIGIYIMFRLLDMADLSAEGTFTTGAAITAAVIGSLSGNNNFFVPILATILSCFGGGLAGWLAGVIHTKMKIPSLLTGILMQTGLYSINLRIMGGKSNISLLQENTIFTLMDSSVVGKNIQTIIICLCLLFALISSLNWFLHTEVGLAFRATGNNQRMSAANGIKTSWMISLGYILANSIIALSGSLVVQYTGYSDMQMGIGTIATGLAAIVIAEVILPNQSIFARLLSIVLGSITYRLIVDLILNQSWVDIQPSDLKLLTAIILGFILFFPELHRYSDKKRAKEEAR